MSVNAMAIPPDTQTMTIPNARAVWVAMRAMPVATATSSAHPIELVNSRNAERATSEINRIAIDRTSMTVKRTSRTVAATNSPTAVGFPPGWSRLWLGRFRRARRLGGALDRGAGI